MENRDFLSLLPPFPIMHVRLENGAVYSMNKPAKVIAQAWDMEDDDMLPQEVLAKLKLAIKTGNDHCRLRIADTAYHCTIEKTFDVSSAGPYYSVCILDADAAEQALFSLAESRTAAVLNRFSEILSHSMNNILTSLIGYANLAAIDIEQGSRAKSCIDNVSLSAERITNLVARIQEATALPRNMPMSVPTHIWSCMEQTRLTVAKQIAHLSVCFGSEDHELRACANPEGLTQVLIELVINAAHAMPQGGSLLVESHEMSPDSVVITIADSGVGMDAETAARMFDPFFTTCTAVGKGLGASIAYRYVSNWNGNIVIESALGEGTSCIIILPKAEAPDSDPFEQ